MLLFPSENAAVASGLDPVACISRPKLSLPLGNARDLARLATFEASTSSAGD
jgi:hypothetical protein